MATSVFAQVGVEFVGSVHADGQSSSLEVRPVGGLSLKCSPGSRNWLDGAPEAVIGLRLLPASRPYLDLQPGASRIVDAVVDALHGSKAATQDVPAGVERLRSLTQLVATWFAADGTPGRAYLTWRNVTNVMTDLDDRVVTVDREESRVTFSIPVDGQDPQKVLGKASVCRADGFPPAQDTGSVRGAYDKACAQACRLRGGGDASRRRANIVLGPRAAATVAHEVVGHLLEADNATARVLGKLGDRVTSAPLSVSDCGNEAGSWGSLVTDDEGTRSERVTLMSDGVIAGHLTDRATAAEAGQKSNGHARRASYADQPLPRISRLEVASGAHAVGSLLAQAGDGLYIDEFSYGYVDPNTGRTRLLVREAHTLAAGNLTDEVFNRGEFRVDAVSVLGAIDGIGDDPNWYPSICLKRRQEVSVLDRGVTLLLDGARLFG